MGSAEIAEVGIQGFFLSCRQYRMVGDEFWGGVIPGAKGIEIPSCSQWDFPTGASPQCLSSSEAQEGLSQSESLWRTYDMIPRATIWFWICKAGKQRYCGCTFVHKHSSFVKTPGFIQTHQRSDVPKEFLFAKFEKHPSPAAQLCTPSLGREWGIWNQNWK